MGEWRDRGEKEREGERQRIKEEVGDSLVKESTITNKGRAAEQRTVSPQGWQENWALYGQTKTGVV